MHPLPNFLYYETPSNQLQIHYPNFQSIFSGTKYTQLPSHIAAIRAIAAITFSALAAFKLSSTMWCWPIIVVAGAAYAGWTIYFHFLCKDSLMEAFYKIVGGKNQFDNLPNINLNQSPNERFAQAIARIKWHQLNDAIYKTETLDGRHVVIVKGLSRDLNLSRQETIFAFIEKIGPIDTSPIPKVSLLTEGIFKSIMGVIPSSENPFGEHSPFYCSSTNGGLCYSNYELRSSISPDMANEFLAQL